MPGAALTRDTSRQAHSGLGLSEPSNNQTNNQVGILGKLRPPVGNHLSLLRPTQARILRIHGPVYHYR
jgi:hypothetical protein